MGEMNLTNDGHLLNLFNQYTCLSTWYTWLYTPVSLPDTPDKLIVPSSDLRQAPHSMSQSRIMMSELTDTTLCNRMQGSPESLNKVFSYSVFFSISIIILGDFGSAAFWRHSGQQWRKIAWQCSAQWRNWGKYLSLFMVLSPSPSPNMSQGCPNDSGLLHEQEKCCRELCISIL